MKDGTAIWHKSFQIPGVLVGTPRAHGTHARAKLEGNLGAQYYDREDLLFGGPGGLPLNQPPAPETREAPRAPIPDKPKPDPIAQAISAVPSYAGDLTLDHLLRMRKDLAGKMVDLDDAIARVRTKDMLKEALGAINFKGEADARVHISADALKIKQDMEQALAAANRLFPTK